MKMFTKLALISSMAISANAMAMQSMDDAAMSATTGQDGINIGLGISAITIDKVLIHDNDGLSPLLNGGTAATNYTAATAAAYNTAHASDPGFVAVTTSDLDPTTQVNGSLGGKGIAGAIVIKGNGIAGDTNQTKGIVITANTAALLASHNLADIVIDTDAGTGNTSTGTGTAFLNVAAKVSGLNINIGEIGVSGSGTNVPATNIRRGNDAANYNKILSGLTLTTGKMDANIQLGAAPQGAMIKLNSTMTGGLTISNLGIIDSSSIGSTVGYSAGPDTILGTLDDVAVASTVAGEIRLDTIKLANTNGTDLTVQADIGVVGGANGFLQIKTMKTATDAYIKGVHLGSATAGSIGDIEVQGMQVYNGGAPSAANVGAVIKISGH